MSNQQVTVDELYPVEWLRNTDLNGNKYFLTITTVEVMTFPRSMDPKQQRAVLSFAKTEKRLITNKTQALKIAEITGKRNVFDWVGERISVEPGRAQNGKPTIVVDVDLPDPDEDETLAESDDQIPAEVDEQLLEAEF